MQEGRLKPRNVSSTATKVAWLPRAKASILVKYSELIANCDVKQDAETEAKTKVIADQASLSSSELSAIEAEQASDLADAQLKAAVKLRPAGVLDPATGRLYTVVDDELVITTPASAEDEVPGPQINPLRAMPRK